MTLDDIWQFSDTCPPPHATPRQLNVVQVLYSTAKTILFGTRVGGRVTMFPRRSKIGFYSELFNTSVGIVT